MSRTLQGSGATVCNNARNQDEEYTWTVFVNGEEVFSGVTNEAKEGEIPGLNDDATYGADDEKNLIPENEKTKYQFTDKALSPRSTSMTTPWT